MTQSWCGRAGGVDGPARVMALWPCRTHPPTSYILKHVPQLGSVLLAPCWRSTCESASSNCKDVFSICMCVKQCLLLPSPPPPTQRSTPLSQDPHSWPGVGVGNPRRCGRALRATAGGRRHIQGVRAVMGPSVCTLFLPQHACRNQCSAGSN
jgi:hypothetical protein